MDHLIELLENPAVFGIHKLPPRATSWPSRKPELPAGEFLYDIDDWRMTLDGSWKLHWSPTPDGRIDGFEACSFDDSAWDCMELPANFECANYGTPIYSNITYPFRCDPAARDGGAAARLDRVLPNAIRPDSCAGVSGFPGSGPDAARSFISRVCRARSGSGSTGSSPDTARTRWDLPSSISRRSCVRAAILSRSKSANIRAEVTWRIRISGGSPACSVPYFSIRRRRCFSRTP